MDLTVILGFLFTTVLYAETPEIPVMTAAPKQPMVDRRSTCVATIEQCPNFQHHFITITSIGRSRRGSPSALHILHARRPSNLPVHKSRPFDHRNLRSPGNFPNSPRALAVVPPTRNPHYEVHTSPHPDLPIHSILAEVSSPLRQLPCLLNHTLSPEASTLKA